MCGYKKTPAPRAQRVYELAQKIGEGSFGAVYSAKVVGLKKKMVAVKICKAETHRRELFMLDLIKNSEVKSKFVSGHLDSYEKDTKLFIVMELMQKPLSVIIDNEGESIPLHAIRVVSKQILLGLSALHSMGIVHNDLKPDNVMLVNHDKNPYQIKLIDFGGAIHADFEGGAKRYPQAMAYIAPESNIKDIVGPASDIWAHALIILEMIIGKSFFYPYMPIEATYQHFKLLGNPSMKFRKLIGDKFKQHFTFTNRVVPVYVDEKKARERKATQAETFEEIYNHLMYEDEIESDVLCLEAFLKQMLTWSPDDRCSADEALEDLWVNPERFEDQKYGKKALVYYRKAKIEVATRKRKIDNEDDKEDNKENKRPAI